jgi:SulP family sulfate permease
VLPAAETGGKSGARIALRAAGAALAAVVIGLMSIALTISVAAIIYQGPLAAFLDRAIAVGLVAGIVMGAASSTLFSYRGTICQPQTSLAVILGLSTGGIAAVMGDAGSERSFTTAVACVAATTMAAGLLAWLLGRLRLGRAARFIPFPVASGFVAATGYLMVMGGIGAALGEPVRLGSLATLFETGNPVRWLPWALAGLAIAGAARRLRRPMVLPAGLALAGTAFYLVLGALGLGLEDAAREDLLLGPFGEGFLPALVQWWPWSIDARALVAQVPSMLAAVGMCIVGAVLSASSIEVVTGSRIDLDHDLRAVGVANMVAALGGSPLGHHSLSLSFLAFGLGSLGPANGWIVAGASALALTVGAPVISALPVGLFATGIVVVGVNLLLTSFVDHRRGAPPAEFAVVVIIPAVTAFFGFLSGVAVGLLAAAVFFVATFARIDVVRLATTGARLRSRLERPAAEQERLAELGRNAAVYSLEGYLFFGTAHRLVQRIEAALDAARVRHVLIDFVRVGGLDTSAARALTRLAATCQGRSVALHLCGLDQAGERLVRGQLPAPGFAGVRFAERLERALEQVEAELLASEEGAPARPPGFFEELRRRHPSADLDSYFQGFAVPADGEVIAQGAPSDSLLVLRSGALRTEVSLNGSAAVTLARCLPGAIVGEVGLYAETPRTARVVAERPSELLRIDTAALERMERDDPALLADFHGLIAATLARRLARTTALLADAELLPK